MTGSAQDEPRDAVDPAPDDAPATPSEKTETAADGRPDPLAEAQALADENWNKYVRLAAEMENLRKRSSRDMENARKFAIERFAGELLAVVDSLEMGLEAGSEASAESLLEGKAATLKQLRATLDKFDVEAVEPEGQPFDPELHEAMTMQPSDLAEPGSVLTVIQKGYVLNGRLLRPARVIVAAEPADEA